MYNLLGDVRTFLEALLEAAVEGAVWWSVRSSCCWWDVKTSIHRALQCLTTSACCLASFTDSRLLAEGNNVNMYSYLCDELWRPADTEARQLLHRSASSTFLALQRTGLSTVGDSVFCCVRSSVEQSSIACHHCFISLHLLLLSSIPSLLSLITISDSFSLFFHLFSGHTVTWHSEHCNHFTLQSVVCTKGTYAIVL